MHASCPPESGPEMRTTATALRPGPELRAKMVSRRSGGDGGGALPGSGGRGLGSASAAARRAVLYACSSPEQEVLPAAATRQRARPSRTPARATGQRPSCNIRDQCAPRFTHCPRPPSAFCACNKTKCGQYKCTSRHFWLLDRAGPWCAWLPPLWPDLIAGETDRLQNSCYSGRSALAP